MNRVKDLKLKTLFYQLNLILDKKTAPFTEQFL